MTAAVNIVGLAAVVAATAQGWLGPDVGRAEQFCEADHWHLFAQPANSLSNLGFTVAALALPWHARRPRHRLTTLGLTATFTATMALLAPASMAMHATNSAAGGVFFVLAMHLVAAFAAVYALSRLAPVHGYGHQGHALWHLLCALAVYLLGRHYTSSSSSLSR